MMLLVSKNGDGPQMMLIDSESVDDDANDDDNHVGGNDHHSTRDTMPSYRELEDAKNHNTIDTNHHH